MNHKIIQINFVNENKNIIWSIVLIIFYQGFTKSNGNQINIVNITLIKLQYTQDRLLTN